MDKNLAGVRALVTGAGSGIGRAIALRLAAAGARVAAADLNPGRARETAELVRAGGGEAVALAADVGSEAEARRMVAEAVAALGGLDVLINNAGVSSAGWCENVSEAEMERVLRVNLAGVLRVTREAAPHLKKSGRGRVVNLSSVEGIRGSGLLCLYSASKAGVIGLTRANAIEFARFKITVNALCPGPIQTEMLAPLIADDKSREKMIRGVPLRRLGTPADVAGAVAFLLSDEAAFITGVYLPIDGGMTAKTM